MIADLQFYSYLGTSLLQVNISLPNDSFQFFDSSGVLLNNTPISESRPFREECRKGMATSAFVSSLHADAYILAVLPIHRAGNTPSGCNTSHTVRSALYLNRALAYGIKFLNTQSDILNNTDIGYILIDSCENPDRILYQIEKLFLTGPVLPSSIVGLTGFTSFEEYKGVSSFLNDKKLLTISLSAANVALSDKVKYPYFMRIVSSNDNEVNMILEILDLLEISNVGIVYSTDSTGIEMTRQLTRMLEESDRIRVEFVVKFDRTFASNEDVLDYIVNDIVQKSTGFLQTIIMFCHPDDLETLIPALKASDAIGVPFIISNTRYIKIRENLFAHVKDVLQDSIIINPYSSYNPALYTEIIEHIDRNAPFHMESAQGLCGNSSHSQNCLQDVFWNSFQYDGQLFINSILALSHGLNTLVEMYCTDRSFCSEAQEQLVDFPGMIWSTIFSGISGGNIEFDSKGNGPASFAVYQVKDNDVVKVSPLNMRWKITEHYTVHVVC